MALGSNSSYDNNKEKEYTPTVYSNYRMNNAASAVDQTSISFSFCMGGTLKIIIGPKIPSSPEDRPKFDFDNGAAIYLNHTKAKILAEEIKNFLRDPKAFNSSGIPSGQGLITVSNGSEFGADGQFIIIRRINPNGQVEGQYAYETKRNYHYSVRGYNDKDNSFEKHMESYNSIELEQVVTLLESYYEAMSGAMAYSVIDKSRFENKYMLSKIDTIIESLGVSTNNSGGSTRRERNKSFFNSNNGNKNVTYETTTIEDIESKFED